MLLTKQFLIALTSLVALGTVHSCAKETSAEARKREETDRAFRRLTVADGTYYGFVEIGEESLVPLQLDISATRNPVSGDDNPALSAAMRLGLFGGVNMTSNAASYDWGSGDVVIRFGDSLEFKGTLKDETFTNAVLDGHTSGTKKVQISLDGPQLLSTQDEYVYQTKFLQNQSGDSQPSAATATLSIKPKVEPRAAAENSDLPLLPALEASWRFNGTGILPQTAVDVIYDPLLGYIELKLRENSIIRVEHVTLDKDVLAVGLSHWLPTAVRQGALSLGSAVSGSVQFAGGFPGLGITSRDQVKPLPPRYLVGNYRSPQNPSVYFPAVAMIDYLNAAGQNAPELAFPTYPKLRLKILICSGGRPLKEGLYEASALDQVSGEARFMDTRQGSLAGYDLKFAGDWTSLTGRFSSHSTGSIDVRNPQLALQDAGSDVRFDCAQGNGEGL